MPARRVVELVRALVSWVVVCITVVGALYLVLRWITTMPPELHLDFINTYSAACDQPDARAPGMQAGAGRLLMAAVS